MNRLIGFMVVSALAGVGCGDDDETILDGGGDGGGIVLDAGMDAGPRDGGPRIDGGPMTTSIGTACTSARGCLGPGEQCLDQNSFTTGSATDPISGLPDGTGPTFTGTAWVDGYCSIVGCNIDDREESCGPGAQCINAGGTPPTGICLVNCEPNPDDNGTCRDGYECAANLSGCVPGCGGTPDCRVRRSETNGIPGIQTPTNCTDAAINCTPRFENECRAVGAGGTPAGMACRETADCAMGLGCVERVCTPCPDDHVCRAAGYAPRCSLDEGAAVGVACTDVDDCGEGLGCVEGLCADVCPADHSCTNVTGIGGVCAFSGNAATNFDALRWVPEADSDIDCNTTTYRCEFSGNPEASAGDNCVEDWDCEGNGTCLEGDEFPGGFCTKIGCEGLGGCAGDGVCISRRIGVDLCLAPCTIGEGSNPNDPATWLTNTGGCPEGQACLWTGAGTAGVCFPAEFNTEVTERNIGEACTDDSDCWSPFGDARCLTGGLFNDGDLPNGYCTVFDCNAPGRGNADTPVCGAENECVGLFGDGADGRLANCWKGCEGAEDCQEGFGCAPLTEGGATLCIPGCFETSECRSTETYVGANPATSTVGRCTAS